MQNDIKQITPISITDDKLQLSTQYSPKQFYKIFYEKLPFVKDMLRQQGFIDDSTYQTLEKWTSSFSDIFEENILDDRITKGDKKLMLQIDNVLIEIFGYSGLTLLRAGLISFNQDLKPFIISYPREELTQILRRTRFTSIGTNIKGVEMGNTYFAQTADTQKIFFADLILNGHKQRFRVYDDQTSQYISTESLTSQPIGTSFGQLLYPITGRLSYKNSIAIPFLNNQYASFEQLLVDRNTMSNIIISGRSTIVSKINELLKDQINYFLISGRFASTIDRIASESSVDKDTATNIVVTLLINYFTNYFMDRIFVPTGHDQYDYLNLIRNMLEDNIDQKDFELPTFPQSHEFMGQFELIFDLLQFTQEELLEITITTLFGFYSTLESSIRFRPAWSLLLDSVFSSLRDPILKTFDFVKNIFDSYPSSSSHFSIYFHKFSVSGINDRSNLKHVIIDKYKKDEIKGTHITVDRQNPQSVLDAITSIIFYMKKYNALCIIKDGRHRDSNANVVAIFDETTLYRPEFIQSFSEDRTIDLARYSLTGYSEQYYQSWTDSYSGISTISNIFPIYRFQDADTFGRRLVSLLAVYRKSNAKIIKLM